MMTTLILLLGGKGTRFDKNTPKQFYLYKNKYIFEYSLENFLKFKEFDAFILVVNKNYLDLVNSRIKKYNKNIIVIKGGETRSLSFLNALDYINKLNIDTNIIVHDAARALTSKDIISKHLDSLKESKCSTTYIGIEDTLVKKEYDLKNRNEYFLLQTPQSFSLTQINEALKKINSYDSEEFSLIKINTSYQTNLIKGNKFNFKLTTNFDLILFVNLIEKFYEFECDI